MCVCFTPESANATLPDVIKRYEFVMKCRGEVEDAERRVSTAMSGDARLEEYVRLKQNFNAKMSKYHTAVEHLEMTGVMIKSLDGGLLDFPARRFDEDVWLCWKEGENQVKFWHSKSEGFSGRKPIDVSSESLV